MEIQDPEAPVLTFSSPENILDPRRGDSRKTRWRGMTVSAAMLIVVLLIGAFFFVLHAPRPAGPVSGNPNQVTQETLRSVSMDSPDDGWAVGAQATVSFDSKTSVETSDDGSLLMHYTNGTWQPVDLANILNPYHLVSNLTTDEGGYLSGLKAPQLNGVSMDSPTDGWAVGDGVFIHYNGQTWRRVTPPAQSNFIAVQMLAPNDGWAISGSVAPSVFLGDDSFFFHYDGKSWQKYPYPAQIDHTIGNLLSIDMISPNEGWASGLTSLPLTSSPNDLEGVILHYLHGAWTVQYTLPYSYFDSVSMDSADDGWAAAPILSKTVSTTGYNLYHYHQGVWTLDTSINIASAIGAKMDLVMNAANDGWVASTNDFQQGDAVEGTGALLLHYDGQTWNYTALPLSLDDNPLVFAGINGFSGGPNGLWVAGAITWASSYSLKESYASTCCGHESITIPRVTPLLAHYTNASGAWEVVTP